MTTDTADATTWIATASSTVRLPNWRLYHLHIGQPVPADVVALMSDEHRALCLRTDDPDAAPFDPDAQLVEVVDYDTGTADDPRLADAPGTNATVDELLGWVDGDPDRAEAVWDREHRRTRQRPTLLEPLGQIIDGLAP